MNVQLSSGGSSVHHETAYVQMETNSGERTNYGNSPRLLHGLDIVIVIALLVASIAFIPFMRAQSRDTVLVYKGADVIAKYPLDEDKVFHVDGLEGTMKIEIKDKQVRVHSSPCRNQICVNRGWISEPYEQIICAPNLIFILINSDSDKEEIDAVSYGE